MQEQVLCSTDVRENTRVAVHELSGRPDTVRQPDHKVVDRHYCFACTRTIGAYKEILNCQASARLSG